ncbi:MAG: ABC transporter ATP-binding protein [Acidobacteriota bacterium]
MSTTPSIMVQTGNLTRRFGEMTAVDQMNLEIREGEIFGLVGPDGAGKTTTLRLFCGLLDPSEGQVQVAGFDVGRNLYDVKDRIGYMAQRFGLYADMTVDENMNFYADLFGLESVRQHTLKKDLLEMTRMAPFRNRLAGQLSGGMKQKLALMCTLLHKPDILFLDEPTNGVDPVSRRDFWAILYQLVKDGMTVCITTAYLDEAERCNRVGLMHEGRIIRCAPPEDLRTSIEDPCYRVTGDNLRSALEYLREMPGILSVEPAGAALHLFLSSEQTSTSILKSDLEEKDLGTLDFKRITPSLEDVFIALIRTTANTDEADLKKGE